MKIGVISDSHGNVAPIKKAVEMMRNIDVRDMWLHAGDYVQDAEYLGEITDVPVIGVAGNGDRGCTFAPEDEFINVGGKKIWLTHGHKYQVKWGIDYLSELAKENDSDIIIFGHNHVYFKEYVDNRLFLNPGSISLPRDGKEGSFAVIKLLKDNDTVQVNRYTI